MAEGEDEEMKSFAIVELIDDTDSTEKKIILSAWIDKKKMECLIPSTMNKEIRKAIYSHKKPTPSWLSFSIKQICKYEDDLDSADAFLQYAKLGVAVQDKSINTVSEESKKSRRERATKRVSNCDGKNDGTTKICKGAEKSPVFFVSSRKRHIGKSPKVIPKSIVHKKIRKDKDHESTKFDKNSGQSTSSSKHVETGTSPKSKSVHLDDSNLSLNNVDDQNDSINENLDDFPEKIYAKTAENNINKKINKSKDHATVISPISKNLGEGKSPKVIAQSTVHTKIRKDNDNKDTQLDTNSGQATSASKNTETETSPKPRTVNLDDANLSLNNHDNQNDSIDNYLNDFPEEVPDETAENDINEKTIDSKDSTPVVPSISKNRGKELGSEVTPTQSPNEFDTSKTSHEEYGQQAIDFDARMNTSYLQHTSTPIKNKTAQSRYNDPQSLSRLNSTTSEMSVSDSQEKILKKTDRLLINQSEILDRLDRLEEDLPAIRKKIKLAADNPIEEEDEDDFDVEDIFPLKTMDALQNLEEKLSAKIGQKKLVKHFLDNIAAKNAMLMCNNILVYAMDDAIANSYSYKGRDRKGINKTKLSFSTLKLSKCILQIRLKM